MKLTFNKAHDLSQLHDELLLAIASVRPVDGEAVMTVEGSGDVVQLMVSDELSAEDLAAIEQVVLSHVPKLALLEPDWSQETGLSLKIFGSPLHLKLRAAAQSNGACAIAYQEVMSSITARNVALLSLGLRGAVSALSAVGQGLSEAELEQIKTWLNQCNIPVSLS